MSSTGLESHVSFVMSLKDSSESLLLELAREGQREAFDELCVRHIAIGKKIAGRILKRPEDAEDAIQDALLRAFLNISKFDGRSKFSTWLTRITINAALMQLRRRQVHREICYDETSLPVAWVSRSFVAELEAAVSRLQQQDMLNEAMKRLPNKLRHTIELRHSEELQVAEVADRLNITVSAAKSRLLRANRALRTSINRRLQIGSITT